MKININIILICMIIITSILAYVMIESKPESVFKKDIENKVKKSVIKDYTIEVIDKENNNVLQTIKVLENEELTKPEIISKEGYTFKYFSSELGEEINFEDKKAITENIKIYAEYVLGDVVIEEIKTEETIKLKLNETYNLNYEIIPTYANNKDIIYSSTNRYTASVDENGVILGNRVGSCYITILDRITNINTRINVVVE